MRMPTSTTGAAVREGPPRRKDAAPRAFPRLRLRGGDVPRGGKPPATGHAGRRDLLSLLAGVICALVATFIACALAPRFAFASTQVHFPNGGTATLQQDGSLTGTARIGDWVDARGEKFPVTMPDGTTTYGWCLDYMHYAPAPGSYNFVATRHGSSYAVTIDSATNTPSSHQVDIIGEFMLPTQRVGNFTWSPVLLGYLKVSKSSSIPSITDANACYDLSAARYGVWKNEACTQRVEGVELVTEADGASNEIRLEPGTYWVKEEAAPRGYTLDVQAHKATVEAAGSTTLFLSDMPLHESPQVLAHKRDIQMGSAQGSASLENAEFVVSYYDGTYDLDTLPERPVRTWTMRSDAEGNLVPTASSFVSGGAPYEVDGTFALPVGTVTIRETKAPHGYWLEGQDADSPASYVAPTHLTHVDGSGSYESPEVQQNVRRAGLSLAKVDAQTASQAQGDASLAGIGFGIFNANEQAVVVDGTSYGPHEMIGDLIYTDASGVAQTAADFLPVGTYEVREMQTNDSMLLDASPQTVTLTDADTNTVVALGKPFSDSVVRGDVRVGKVSRETTAHLPQGEATLEGALIGLRLESEQPVVVGGATFQTGQVVTTLVTDTDGVAQTEGKLLPYGTYTAFEEKAPQGYLLNEEWSQTFSIRNDGELIDISGEDMSVDDQVMRGGFSFNKVDKETMERMPLVAFRVTSTTGESHVLVSDENGFVDTEAWAHDERTNANDEAVVDGIVDEAALDPSAGIWFSGRSDQPTTPENDLGALPYDTYRVEELRSEANAGHELVSFTVVVHRHDLYVDMGTVNDAVIQTPRIATTLGYAKERVVPARDDLTLVDVVSYEGLVGDRTYTIEGTLCRKDDGSVLAQAEREFTASLGHGTEELEFRVDTSELVGTSLVAQEQLFCDGEPLTEPEGLEVESQTVHVPRIATSLADEEGNKEVAAAERITLVDTVRYENVVPGLSYELSGTLMDKETGEPVKDAAGQTLRGATSFVPDDSEGEVQVEFTFDGALAQGRSLVAFETLSHANREVAAHADINDEGQTIHVPSICTELTDAHGNHIVAASPTVEVVDTVEYQGLEGGGTYTMEGTLVDRETEEELAHAAVSFVADESSGSLDMPFAIDGASCAGRTLVAFERLVRDERELARHADAEDEAQTVYVPAIRTTLTGESGTHEVGAGHVVLTDAISYEGLRPGVTYTVFGTLVDKDTGEELSSEEGKPITAATEFAPGASEGMVEVSFELDTLDLAGRALVAFEHLREGKGDEAREVAAHTDINDAAQTVRVPRLQTTATNADSEGKPLTNTGKAHVRDVVKYEGLTPGATYAMQGSIRDKKTGKALVDKNGSEVSVSKTFVADETNGSVTLDFEFAGESISGDGVVVFESCLHEGREVASHKDLKDKNQTVLCERIAVSEGTSRQHSPKTGDATNGLLAVGIAAFGGAALFARRRLR